MTTKRYITRSICTALSIALLAGSAQAEEIVLPFTDSSRLVSIGGSLTEIVFALGEQDRLVARDTTSTYPVEATQLPDIGYMRALAPEGVLSANPSALLVINGSGPPEVLEVLSHSGVPYQTVPETFSREGILRKVDMVGAVLGVEEKAAALVAELDATFASVEAVTAQIEQHKRVLFILSTQGGKILVSGSATAASSIIEMAGAENAIDAFEGYKAITEEALIAARPDLILMMDRGGDHAASNAELWANPAISLTPAGRNKAIIRMDGGYLLGFGPRTPAAVLDLVHAVYGDLAEGK